MDVLRPEALEQIYAHASRGYPEECCGFVFADGSVYLGSNIQNELHRKNPEIYPRSAANGYTFSVADTLLLSKAFRSDNPVVVIYHSHPDVGAYFSDEDEDKALFMGEPIYPVSYLVVDVRQGQALGSKLFAWDGKHFALQPFNDLHTELSMNAVSFPDILVRVAKLPESTLEGAGTTLREVIENLCSSHPQLRAHLFHEKNNQLKEHFLFTAEEELVGADDPLPEKARIEVLLATSGGMDVDALSNEEVQRYVRHITLPGVGREGQLNLKKAKVLIIGTVAWAHRSACTWQQPASAPWGWWTSMWWKAATCNARSSMATARWACPRSSPPSNACKTSTVISRSMPTTPP